MGSGTYCNHNSVIRAHQIMAHSTNVGENYVWPICGFTNTLPN